jgi:PAS domain S-box-containing protein
MAKRKPVIDALDAVRNIRAGVDDAALMKRYNISFQGLQSLFGKLIASGALTQAEIDERKRRGVEDSVIIDVKELLLQQDGGKHANTPRTLQKCVLALSDDRSFQESVTQYLSVHELHVAKCEDKRIDEKLLARMRPDVLLADVSLLRKQKQISHAIETAKQADRPVPVILVADAWHRELAEEGVELGAYDFVEKPIEGKTVLRTIRRALEYAGLLQLKNDQERVLEDQLHEITLEVVRSKDFLKGILDSSTLVSVALTDLKDNILFWNKGAENIFGYLAEDMVGSNIRKIFPSDRLSQETVAQLRKVVDDGLGTASGKINHVAKDGRLLTISLALSPMREAGGELLGILWMGLDVTEEVRQNKEILKLLHEVRNTQEAAIFALAKLTESRGEETGAHLSRICAYCRELCNRLSKREKFHDTMTGKFIDDLARSAVLHDIGMVSLPDSILWSPHRLHPKERELMIQHPIVGGRALEEAVKKLGEGSFLSLAMDVAYYHHESWDGSGYPFGKKGDETPLAARIVAVADAYDDLTTAKGTKVALSHKEAVAQIVEGKGALFDPELVDAFQEAETEFHKIRETISS